MEEDEIKNVIASISNNTPAANVENEGDIAPEVIEQMHTVATSSNEENKDKKQNKRNQSSKIANIYLTQLKNRESKRIELTDYVVNLISFYLFVVAVILFLSGSPSTFRLSDTVLCMLLGTTTANLLGAFYIVLHFYYPSSGQDKIKIDDLIST